MRVLELLSILVIGTVGWGISSGGREHQSSGTWALTVIPTAFQELNELRINTGESAVLSDGTMNAVYVKKLPAEGNIYLNFHIDIASEAGPFVLHPGSIVLQAGSADVALPSEGGSKAESAAETLARSQHTPMDWFIDSGAEELRGDSLTVKDKALVQFTIEVPRADYDALTLFVLAQRVGSVREIRDTIARDRGIE